MGEVGCEVEVEGDGEGIFVSLLSSVCEFPVRFMVL